MSFFENSPRALRDKLESMPRQAIYTLASREGALEKKWEIIENYRGEKKQALLALIRELFPLHEKDRRSQNHFEATLKGFEKARYSLNKLNYVSDTQKEELKRELSNLKLFIDHLKIR